MIASTLTQAKRNILIFHAGALGDFVVTLFVPMGLRRLYPEHKTVYVTHASKGELAGRFVHTAGSDINANGWHTLHSEAPSLHVQARELLDHADLAICFSATGEMRFRDSLRELAPGMTVVLVNQTPPPGFDRHITSHYLSQVSAHFPAEPFESAIHQIASLGLNPPRSQSNRIILHLGAGSPRKCWPLDYFLQLAGALRQDGHEVAVMVGEAELERMPQRIIEELRNRHTLLQPRDYLELAEDLLSSRLLVTNDNGPGHLLAALGGQVLSLFGPTNATLWRPMGPRAHVMCGESLGALLPSAVLEKVHQLLATSSGNSPAAVRPAQ